MKLSFSASLRATVLLVLCMYGLSAVAASTVPVQFAKGTSSAMLKGSIKGYNTVDYTLNARAGQTMTATLNTKNTATYFNVLPPGSNDVAIFIGSSNGNSWTGKLPKDGQYKIRVYMMRSAARRDEVANYTLNVAIKGNASAASTGMGKAPSSDAKVKGTSYHATGSVSCSLGKAAPGSSECAFGVVRGAPGSGNAKLDVTPPGGLKRVLIFKGNSVTTDDGVSSVKARKAGDDWLIDVNDYEHYQITEAIIYGD